MTAIDVIPGKAQWAVEQSDVTEFLSRLPNGCVHCCVTSPPYFALRSYLPKDHPDKPCELGSEKSPQEFVKTMVKVFGEVRRVLRNDGVLWVNIGDTYSASGRGGGGGSFTENDTRKAVVAANAFNGRNPPAGMDALNLCGIPQRLALAMQADGWVWRSDVIWHKPAPMPESLAGVRWERCRVKVGGRTRGANHARSRNGGNPSPPHPDNGIVASECQWSDCHGCPKCKKNDGLVLRYGSWRPTRSHEHILMFAKGSGYYADGESVRKPAAQSTVERDRYSRILDDADEQFAVRHDHETVCTGGANLRDVWTIASEALKEAHYAAFPTELVRRCVAAATSDKGVCAECGAAWARVIESGNKIKTGANGNLRPSVTNHFQEGAINCGRGYRFSMDGYTPGEAFENKTIGWRPTCKCQCQETIGALVLDIFTGSGRTAIQSLRMGRRFIGCDLNPAYVEMARRLILADNPLFNAETKEPLFAG